LIALTISWNTIDIELYGGMGELSVLTAVFQLSCRGRFAVGRRPRRLSIPLFAPSCPLPDRAGLAITNKRSAQPCDITTYSILMGYLTARLEHDLSSLVTDRGEQLTALQW
jgi:hypothetical protein